MCGESTVNQVEEFGLWVEVLARSMADVGRKKRRPVGGEWDCQINTSQTGRLVPQCYTTAMVADLLIQPLFFPPADGKKSGKRFGGNLSWVSIFQTAGSNVKTALHASDETLPIGGELSC